MQAYKMTYSRPDMEYRCQAIKWAHTEKEAVQLLKNRMKARGGVVPTNIEVKPVDA